MGRGFNALNQTLAHANTSDEDNVVSSRQGRFAESVNDTREERIKKFLGRNGIMIVAIMIAVLALIICSSIAGSRSDALAKQDAKILSLQQKIDSTKHQYDTERASVMRQSTGGIDAEHRDKDEQVAEQLFRDALTWNSVPEYLEARQKVMRIYGLDEQSEFMTVFMPGELQGVVRKAPSGKTYYAADPELKSHYTGVDTVVTAVNGDIYSYWAKVEARVESKSGQASQVMTVLVTFDVVDGKIKNIKASTTPLGVEKSG